MQIYIMRHGEAEAQASSDQLRALTTLGKNEAKSTSEKLADVCFDLVLVSPYIRAQQTKDEFLSQLNNKPKKVQTLDLITPSGSAVEVHDYLDGLINVEQLEHVAIISHMPFVSYFTAELTYDSQMPIFQTAAIAKIDYNPETMKGELVDMLCPFGVCIA